MSSEHVSAARHPGEVLAEVLAGRGVSAYRIAVIMRIPYVRTYEIVKGRRRITPDTALRLDRALWASRRRSTGWGCRRLTIWRWPGRRPGLRSGRSSRWTGAPREAPGRPSDGPEAGPIRSRSAFRHGGSGIPSFRPNSRFSVQFREFRPPGSAAQRVSGAFGYSATPGIAGSRARSGHRGMSSARPAVTRPRRPPSASARGQSRR